MPPCARQDGFSRHLFLWNAVEGQFVIIAEVFRNHLILQYAEGQFVAIAEVFRNYLILQYTEGQFVAIAEVFRNHLAGANIWFS
jgi:hypothetical protein